MQGSWTRYGSRGSRLQTYPSPVSYVVRTLKAELEAEASMASQQCLEGKLYVLSCSTTEGGFNSHTAHTLTLGFPASHTQAS